MRLLEDKIREEGIVIGSDVLKVDSFLNHQMSPALFDQMALEWFDMFRDDHVTKILTIEASGIGLACITGMRFGCPVVFAKKSRSSNTPEDVYTAVVKSYTRGIVADVTVSKKYIGPEDRVLIIDDFMATGEAAEGLMKIVEDAGAVLVGIGIAIEKSFQGGGDLIRARGIRVESLARIAAMNEDTGITFLP